MKGVLRKEALGSQRQLGSVPNFGGKVLPVRSGNRRNRGRSQVEGRGSTKGIPDFVILLIKGVRYNNKTLFLILK